MKTKRLQINAVKKIGITFLMVALFSGCANQGGIKKLLQQAKDALNLALAQDLTIANVTVAASGTGGTGGNTTTIFLNSQTATNPLTSYCTVGNNGPQPKPCKCDFEWSELNDSTGTNVIIQRKVQTNLTTVQPFLATCPAPETYDSEIPNGTKIKIKIVPTIANTGTGFFMNQYNFTKGTTIQADYFDSEGRAFNDIKRYGCYEKTTKGLRVINKTQAYPNTDGTEEKKVPLATAFCSEGESQGVEGCEAVGPAQSSAQSYYYNLFMPSQNIGFFHGENARYVCPRVNEALDGSGSIGGSGKPWPLDSSFSLAQAYSPSSPVPVTGPSVLGVSTDAQTAATSCSVPGAVNNNGNASPNASAIAYKCLGFALKPETNGTCPSITDSSGHIRLTYRLRKYVAMYPTTFKANGKVIAQPPATDVAYVLDRPVNSGDPLKPYTMLGPKPCPFAYLDHQGTIAAGAAGAAANGDSVSGWQVVGAANDPINAYNVNQPTGATTQSVPTYRGTMNTLWDGKNVDGTALPNIDNQTLNSCSAMIPLVNYTAQGDAQFVTLGTTHISNNDGAAVHTVSLGANKSLSMDKVYVRPTEEWSPHYVEDKNFLGCAPQAEEFKDPPLHFSKDTDGNIGWCAEAYPTQVNRVAQQDRPYFPKPTDAPTGYFRPFTSHVVKNSASASCNFSPLTLPTNYPGGTTGPATCVGGASTATSCTALGSGTPSTAATTANNYFVCRSAEHPNNLYIDKDGSGNTVCANQTCDRTVTNDGTGPFNGFPLLANPREIETTLRADPTYNCTVTYDEGNGKQGVRTPSSGCCNSSVVTLTTGGAGATNDHAHLEPDRACLIPNY